jgi:hypothetical protein
MDWFLILTPLLVLGVLALFGFLGCDIVLGLAPVLAPPTFDPAPGTYLSEVSVTLSKDGQDGTIHFTTDGSDPSINSSEYTGPITVSATTTIKAVLIQHDFGFGDVYSSIATGMYTVGGPLAFVQSNEGTAQGATTSVSVTFTNNQMTGNLNVVVVAWNDNSASVDFVQDSHGNGPGGTYALAVGPTAGNGLQQSIYYAPNIKAGANTVTVIFKAAANQPNLRILEYSGLDQNSPVDVTVANAGSGTQVDTGFVLTTFAQDMLFAAGTTAGGFNNASGGYTVRIFEGGHLAEDQFVSAAENYNATATLKAASNWAIQLVAFKR